MFDRRLVQNFDYLLLALVLLITAMGIVNLYSAGFNRGGGTSLYIKQMYFLAVGLGQWVSYRVITSPPVGSRARQIANLGLLPLMTAFCLFTYWPPYLFLFADPRSGRFGIPAL